MCVRVCVWCDTSSCGGPTAHLIAPSSSSNHGVASRAFIGFGVYRTWDGQQYIGTWENDVLAKDEPVRIEFADSSVYTGVVSKQMDFVSGTYQFHDGSSIRCDLFGKANVPTYAGTGVGDGLVFVDPSGVIWDRIMDDQWLIVRHARQFNLGGDGGGNGGGGGDDDHN